MTKPFRIALRMLACVALITYGAVVIIEHRHMAETLILLAIVLLLLIIIIFWEKLTG